MDFDLSIKLDELIELIEKDERIINLKKIKNELLNDSNFINLLTEIKSKPYISIQEKEKLYSNEKYKEYQHLENEIYFLTLDINSRLNKLTDKSRCN